VFYPFSRVPFRVFRRSIQAIKPLDPLLLTGNDHPLRVIDAGCSLFRTRSCGGSVGGLNCVPVAHVLNLPRPFPFKFHFDRWWKSGGGCARRKDNLPIYLADPPRYMFSLPPDSSDLIEDASARILSEKLLRCSPTHRRVATRQPGAAGATLLPRSVAI